jgi:hypothetical protein
MDFYPGHSITFAVGEFSEVVEIEGVTWINFFRPCPGAEAPESLRLTSLEVFFLLGEHVPVSEMLQLQAGYR